MATPRPTAATVAYIKGDRLASPGTELNLPKMCNFCSKENENQEVNIKLMLETIAKVSEEVRDGYCLVIQKL